MTPDAIARALLNLGAQSVSVFEDLTYCVEPEELDVSQLSEAAEAAEAELLDEAKEGLIRTIDEAAEAERLKYITGGVGQALTYSEKARQAQEALQAAAPKSADYPLLSAEIGVTGETLQEVAQTVDAAYRAWLEIGGEIESTRLSAKAAIRAAVSLDEAKLVVSDINWPRG